MINLPLGDLLTSTRQRSLVRSQHRLPEKSVSLQVKRQAKINISDAMQPRVQTAVWLAFRLGMYSLSILKGAMYGELKCRREVSSLHTTRRAGRALRPAQRTCGGAADPLLVPGGVVT